LAIELYNVNDHAEEPFKLWAIDTEGAGFLCVSNNLYPYRTTTWVYHVAPVVRNSAGDPIVLDPSISPCKPLFWKDWLATMVRDPDNEYKEGGRLQVALSDSWAYDPDDETRLDSDGPDHPTEAYIEMEDTYLIEERITQVDNLGRDAGDYLYNDEPVWACGTQYEAEDTIHTEQEVGGPYGDNAWNIWSNGRIYFDFVFTGGTQTITIRASGSQADGEDPEMRVDIIQEYYNIVRHSFSAVVDPSIWKDYHFTFNAPVGIHRVAIYFVNDFYNPPEEDRNLYVDVIKMPCAD
jgi:hypothetical protein